MRAAELQPNPILTARTMRRFAILPGVAVAILIVACTSDDETVTTSIDEASSETAFIQTAEAESNKAVGIDLAESEYPSSGESDALVSAVEIDEVIVDESSQVENLPTSFTAALKTDAGATEELVTETDDLPSEESVTVTAEEQAAGDRNAWELRLVDIWKNSINGVVLINLDASVLFGDGIGAGWFWDQEGHIVTNYHVVRPTSTFATPQTITVETFDGDQYDAEFIGGDSVSDIAVIKIDAEPGTLNPLPIGDSAILEPGMTAIALGHPFGADQAFSMTHGIISGLSRSIQSQGARMPVPAVIQTDADMNPGNSGGPLLNSSGEVVGVNTQIRSLSITNSGVGFATPINLVRRVVSNLIEHGVHEYPLIGISSWVITPAWVEQLNLEEGQKGLIITAVSPDGPADKAGIIPDSGVITSSGLRVPKGDGDIVVRIDNVKIDDIYDLRSYIMLNTSPGDEIVIEVFRDGRIIPITLTLGSWGNEFN